MGLELRDGKKFEREQVLTRPLELLPITSRHTRITKSQNYVSAYLASTNNC
jgi:hypothetical protein